MEVKLKEHVNTNMQVPNDGKTREGTMKRKQSVLASFKTTLQKKMRKMAKSVWGVWVKVYINKLFTLCVIFG